MAKPPSPKGKWVTVPSLRGESQEYPAEHLKFRPAAYGLLVVNQDILLSLSAFTDRWDLPGGGVEPWEPIEVGLAREFFEETGLTVMVQDFAGFDDSFVAFFGRPFHSLRLYYRVCLTGTNDLKPAHDELTDLRWWPVDGLPEDRMMEREVEIIHKLFPRS